MYTAGFTYLPYLKLHGIPAMQRFPHLVLAVVFAL